MSNAGSPGKKRYSAYHYGILGARSFLALQSYGGNYAFDGKAYTLTAIYNDGTLRIYATWPSGRIPSLSEGVNPLKQIQYDTILVAGWVIGSSLQAWCEALTALRGAVERTARWRESLIAAANAHTLEDCTSGSISDRTVIEDRMAF
ncbi:uncharacterized protein A1O5_00816 [Cladophialophora psammophila CBS 110553]|uniref:Uncharacterized protein n=1 Tax=Cladophialophora psammophila CBS 110553 TaxID=1182543 RepID=W9X7V3_9EURO|nr:uncharacterized protein A1O5_00816 [Cladophialophora psammophila CBS 110553]EXJ76308.1 hypothetical protein A1O5_00816 [Cladophialophora psammophila CBS 110553]